MLGAPLLMIQGFKVYPRRLSGSSRRQGSTLASLGKKSLAVETKLEGWERKRFLRNWPKTIQHYSKKRVSNESLQFPPIVSTPSKMTILTSASQFSTTRRSSLN